MKRKAISYIETQQTPTSKIDLLVHGQGVVVFNIKPNSPPCKIYLYNKDQTDGLEIMFNKNSVSVHKISEKKHLSDNLNKKGLSLIDGAYYWFSIDSQNQQLYAGVGEPRMETVIYKHFYSGSKEGSSQMRSHWTNRRLSELAKDSNHDDKKFLESIISAIIPEEFHDFLKIQRLLRDPITSNVPLLIKNTDDLTMLDIARSTYMPKSNLSLVSQKLYDCISGKNFVLDDDEFPDFSKAIEYSIKTPHMWCHKKLKEKSNEFDKDKPNIKETYLRITLGQNNGESPGIPYVMEIWPVGHYSPIHNHAGANAVIRVLHGKINVKLFPFLAQGLNQVKPFSEAQFVKEDITWISPTLNQTHQLVNLEKNSDTCVTIQCYMYENDNSLHYDYFDYVDGNGKIEKYEPDSDMDFAAFREKMMDEWNNRKCN
jgi:hypothetical protein